MKGRNATTLSGMLLVLLSAGFLIAGASSPPSLDWWVIAGGGAPSSGGSVSLNDTFGQPVIGSAATSGDVVSVDGYWSGAGLAGPLGVADLRASRADTRLQLDWTAVKQNEAGETITGVTYNVYRALDQPYSPATTPYQMDVSDITYTDIDPNVIGDTAHGYTYVIRAFYDGTASATSNRVSVFSFPLTP